MESNLSVIDLLLLGDYDGKPIDYELPLNKIELYGRDYQRKIENLLSNGYLEYGSSEIALTNLTIPVLKDILRRNNQKLSGKKNELISRIIENISAENYADSLPKIYVATAKGRAELDTRYQYAENQKMQYGFLNTEILEYESRLLSKGKFTADAVLEELFLHDIVKNSEAQDYGLLRGTYYSLSKYFKKRNRVKESLRSLLSMIYYDLSGMHNNNFVEDYGYMGYVFETSIWNEIDKARTALNFTDEDLMKLFDEAIALSVKVPFSYFDTATMKKIILDRLRGEINLLQKYESFSQRPPEQNFEYAYLPTEEPPKNSRNIWWIAVVVIVCIAIVLLLV